MHEPTHPFGPRTVFFLSQTSASGFLIASLGNERCSESFGRCAQSKPDRRAFLIASSGNERCSESFGGCSQSKPDRCAFLIASLGNERCSESFGGCAQTCIHDFRWL